MRSILICVVSSFAMFSCSGGGNYAVNQPTISKNSYKYGEDKEVAIAWAGYDKLENGTTRLILSPTAPVSNNVTALPRRIEVYIPEGGFEINYNMNANRVVIDGRKEGWLFYYIDNVSYINLEGNEFEVDYDQILSGTMHASKVGTDSYSVFMTVNFDNGKTLELNYNGTFSDATAILEMPEGEGELELQYHTERQPIKWGGFTESEGLTTITLSVAVPVRNTRMSEMMGGVLVMDIPSKYLNNNVYLHTGGGLEHDETRPPWRFVYNGVYDYQTKWGYEAGSGNEENDDTMGGTFIVSRKEGTDEFKVSVNIQFNDYSTYLVAEWEGTLVDINEEGLPLVMW